MSAPGSTGAGAWSAQRANQRFSAARAGQIRSKSGGSLAQRSNALAAGGKSGGSLAQRSNARAADAGST